MNVQPHHPGTHPLTAVRPAGARLGRLAAVLAAITAGLLASAAAVPAAFAGMNPIPWGPGGYVGDPYIGIMGTGPIAPVPATTTVRVITTGGMAAWQITLIALAAALVAATAAVFADRARTARRGATAA
jgi:hypothetical protein